MGASKVLKCLTHEEHARLTGEIERLRAALKPFADLAEGIRG
jgi:hypothetical protein